MSTATTLKPGPAVDRSDPRPTSRAGQSLQFELPPERVPVAPPERRGIARDGVRLLVASADAGLADVRFSDLADHLSAGDLLVVNTSTTRPAAIDAAGPAGPVVVHFATHQVARWVVELRRPDGSGPVLDAQPGWVLALAEGARLTLSAKESAGPAGQGVRLWRARLELRHGTSRSLLEAHGRPITYGRNVPEWPLEDYQTIFARHHGSAEMPSAGRPFTRPLLERLRARGVLLAQLELHAGVSSQEIGEAPGAERFRVGPVAARLVNDTRRAGGRVVAVGTTVVRALESAAGRRGEVHAANGWTDLVISPRRGVRVVSGLITGWHDAGASHLELLEAVAGGPLVEAAYEQALRGGYQWHQFGDSALLLP